MSNLLIVESENDKYFIERLKKELNNANFEIDNEPICSIDDYQCLGGLSEEKLKNKLFDVVRDADADGINKIGILIDADDKGIKARLELVNSAIKSIDTELNILAMNTWYYSQSLMMQFSCHILNIDGHGELETLLKAIKSKDSVFADCLQAWQQCLTTHDKSISQKDFDKFWISVYGRYDCCTKKESKQAGCKCTLDATLKKDVWNFNHDVLIDLKTYLHSFTIE